MQLFSSVMACKSDWKASKKLRNDLEKYVRENIKKCEILDYVKRDYPDYPWNMATLSRRLSPTPFQKN